MNQENKSNFINHKNLRAINKFTFSLCKKEKSKTSIYLPKFTYHSASYYGNQNRGNISMQLKLTIKF